MYPRAIKKVLFEQFFWFLQLIIR